ncbi:MAG: PAS domain S-box protein [Gammaproteobacteria bacterium]|nr:PAS domain S-box protein [Gammaproteobacteria bacterium]NIR97882.1 PAS domain S-box protein [Gammaproteobacteria bacterium]NIT63587.1 PAS domain S-box protein [Gammaproteobacteria bacterium]NIV20523.1 PAS domain S-box protein [Gammaproteobacteria bacterium]NIX11117.1 PAS domain S-box protein [Gammaproteobacteria bacterium]
MSESYSDKGSAAWADFERFFHQVLEAAPDAMVVVDNGGRIVLVNHMAERMLGYSRSELVGQPVEMLVPERFRRRHPRHRDAYGRDPRPRYMGEGRELSARRKDGTELPVELSLIPVHAEGQQLVTVGVRDVTERHRVRETLEHHARELERSNAELEQFAYVASHDLQEPLRMVASYAQLLQRRYMDRLDEDAQEFIGYMVDGATHMQDLINDLLAYSRVGTRGKPFSVTRASMAVQRALGNLHRLIEDSGAKAIVGELPELVADEAQLVQLFQNLIGNGIKFRGEAPPVVRVGCERGDGEFRFYVRDDGIGIDPKFAERVFLLFQRLHGKREYPGTGIGLAICKRIVERHAGRIWVESRPGSGSTFWFTIPYRPPGQSNGEIRS